MSSSPFCGYVQDHYILHPAHFSPSGLGLLLPFGLFHLRDIPLSPPFVRFCPLGKSAMSPTLGNGGFVKKRLCSPTVPCRAASPLPQDLVLQGVSSVCVTCPVIESWPLFPSVVHRGSPCLLGTMFGPTLCGACFNKVRSGLLVQDDLLPRAEFSQDTQGRRQGVGAVCARPLGEGAHCTGTEGRVNPPVHIQGK